jgi:aminomethyltransferase
VRGFASATTGNLRKTALYDLHVKNGGTMVEFGGFQMPVQYKGLSISDSVLWTRNKASLFDVSPTNSYLNKLSMLILGWPYGAT